MGSYVFAFVVMLSVLIFVHEAGHFIAAKLCGVRVLKFSLGFGPAIGVGRFRLRWKRGHTEYVCAWIPLGGFVKMLGETPDETGDAEVRAHPSEALGSKPLWQKLIVVFAGPAMNLALPVALFMATLAVGIPRPAAVIGMVETGSPADAARLRPGDRITAVDGAPVRWWESVEGAVRAAPGATLSVAYEREGTPAQTRLAVAERSGLDEFGNVQPMGWVGFDFRPLRPLLGISDAGSPAHAAGLRSGDEVIAVGGEPVEDWEAFRSAYARAGRSGEVALALERAAQDELERVEIALPALGDVSALGVVPATVLLATVSPDSPAARSSLEPGDLILTVNGTPVRSFSSFAEAVRSSGGRTLQIVYARDGELHAVAITPELSPIDLGLGIEERRYLVGITAQLTTLAGEVILDRERNPLVALPRAVTMTVDVTGTFLRGFWKLITGQVSRRQLAGPIGIAAIAGNALQRGWEAYLAVMVLISVNLGILNLLPIPILDGGQATLFLVESIKRSPLSLRSREIFQQIGLTVIVLLMGLAFWNDISRHWSKVVDWLRSGSGL